MRARVCVCVRLVPRSPTAYGGGGCSRLSVRLASAAQVRELCHVVRGAVELRRLPAAAPGAGAGRRCRRRRRRPHQRPAHAAANGALGTGRTRAKASRGGGACRPRAFPRPAVAVHVGARARRRQRRAATRALDYRRLRQPSRQPCCAAHGSGGAGGGWGGRGPAAGRIIHPILGGGSTIS